MNKINIQNKLYFVLIATVNILFITLLMFSLSYMSGGLISLLISVALFGITIILSLCSGVFLFQNKNKLILKKDLKPLALFIIFTVLIWVLRAWSSVYFDDLAEELINQIFSYHLSFLIIPNILLNVYSILMSIDKK